MSSGQILHYHQGDLAGPQQTRTWSDVPPHTGAYYEHDNEQVWNLLRHTLYDTDGWSWISRYARSADGRNAYLALKQHYLGEGFMSRIKTEADWSIEKTFYDSEKPSFTFERYAQIHAQAHRDLEDHREPMTEDQKVRKFLQGIRASYLQTAVSTVIATPNLSDTTVASII